MALKSVFIIKLLCVAFLMQACSDSPSMAPEDEALPPATGGSSSSGSVSSSSSFSSSSASAAAAEISDAREFVSVMNQVSVDVSPKALMVESDAADFDLLAAQLQNSPIAGDEVENVLLGLSKAGWAFGAKFVESIAGRMVIDPPEGVSLAGYQVTSAGTTLSPQRYYSFTLDQEILLSPSECAGQGASCVIRVDVDWELAFPNSRPGGSVEGDTTSLVLSEMHLNIARLTASNSYVSIAVTPGEGVLSASQLVVRALMDAHSNLLSAVVASESLQGQLSIEILETQNGQLKASGDLLASFAGFELNIDSVSVTGLSVELLDMGVSSVSGAVDITNNVQTFTAEYVLGAQVEGVGPFSYVFGQSLDVLGENDSNFLGVDMSVDYALKTSGSEVFSGSMLAKRESHNVVGMKNFSFNYNDLTYLLSGEVTNDGQLRVLEAFDPRSSVRVVLDATSGITLGGVADTAGNTLGSVNKTESGALEIIYADGTVQELLPSIKVPAPLLPSEAF